MNRGHFIWMLAVVASVATGSHRLLSSTPLFYDDDPIAREIDSKDAIGVQPKAIGLLYDVARSLFATPGDRRDIPALNTNTIDEVPDSSWFVDRILARGTPGMTAADVARGPGSGRGPAPGPWSVISGKKEGVSPGFTVLDANGERYFIKFDPPDHPEMASGAEAIVTRLFHAIGYHVPENSIAWVRREDLVLTEESTIVGPGGRERRMNDGDLDALLRRAARLEDRSYRVLASKALSGFPVGPFAFAGTRPDDPNDVVPHEHRRELRALRVFSAWVNHVDTKALNTLDTLVLVDGRTLVRHHLIDFGSTLGSAAVKPRDFEEGHEYLVEPGNLLKGALSAGLFLRPYERVRYVNVPSVGRFSAERFDPARWRPRVPNPAFLRAREDDLFWGARRVMAFSDEMIRAAVSAGRYSDPRAAEHVAQTLIARRDLIGRAWMAGINPVVDPSFDGSTLSFRNAAADAGVAARPQAYRAQWFFLDNATGDSTPVGDTTSIRTRIQAPATLARLAHPFVGVDLSATGAVESWEAPVRIVFRRSATDDSWQLVGLTRTAADRQ